jgi:hypothetical protein
MHYIQIAPFIGASDVIAFPCLSLVENQFECSAVILDVQPVPDVATIPIDWQRAFCQAVVN